MSISVGFYPSSSYPRPQGDKADTQPIVDTQPLPTSYYKSRDKHDWLQYTMYNAPFMGIAGLLGGLQQAFYVFEKMPPAVSRNSFSQAVTLYSIVAKKYAWATAIGAVFCASEALIENARGKHDTLNGAVAGAAAGAAFGFFKPWPQPMAWPFAFAATAVAADIIGEKVPAMLKGQRSYGPLEGRENWGDPVPPRPPILQTGGSMRPTDGGHFWRSS